uniref:type I protein arginine methyltransferase n=1 Tax=Daphnia galeata TaxID=27404 RepID=A0A8J2RGT1_9CRUS|nr:unnamed protein product [Daphnia galeata]
MDPDGDLPVLLETSETNLPHQSFHESSTNVSVADSAAATMGSESFREFSDRGQISSNSSSDNDVSDEDSFVESGCNSNKPSTQDRFNESDMSSDEDWIEEPCEDEPMHNIKCLFCSEILSNAHSVLEHCQTVHHFSLPALQKKHGMDQYSFIRLINFIRSCSASSREVMDMDMPIWEQDKFMMPVIEDDALLMYDFDGDGPKESASDVVSTAASSTDSADNMKVQTEGKMFSNFRVANAEGGHVTLSQAHFDDLHATLQKMQLVVDESNATLKQYHKDMESMRKAMKHMVMGDKQKEEEDLAAMRCEEEEDEEDGYFSGYAHFSIHHDMLADKPRTDSYRDAIIKNSHMIRNKIVLDLGCGTGILSMFAVQAGASKVIGVDQSQIIFNAMAIIRENKMENKIKLVRGKIEEVTLNEPMVDVLVSEWMGYFLLFEGMLDSVIHARNKYLAPDGLMLPNSCSISMMAIGDSERYSEMVRFWDDVYGLKMTSMRPEVLREASIETVPVDKILSDPSLVLQLDLKTCTSQETEFFRVFQLKMTREDKLTALVGSFDVTFHLDHTVLLSTSPYSSPTHWKQTVFYLPEPITVHAGQVLDCSIKVQRHSKEVRWLDVTITINGDKFKYSLS